MAITLTNIPVRMISTGLSLIGLILVLISILGSTSSSLKNSASSFLPLYQESANERLIEEYPGLAKIDIEEISDPNYKSKSKSKLNLNFYQKYGYLAEKYFKEASKIASDPSRRQANLDSAVEELRKIIPRKQTPIDIIDEETGEPVLNPHPYGDEVVLITATDGKGNNAEIPNLLERITENREDYCQKHNYTCFFKDTSEYNLRGKQAHWGKIWAIIEAFEKFPNAQWVWVLDADAIIMDTRIDLARWILNPQALDKRILYKTPIWITDNISPVIVPPRETTNLTALDFIIAADNGGINAGSFFFKRSEFTNIFLQMWTDHFWDETMKTEQDTITQLLIMYPYILEHTAIVTQRSINNNAFGDTIAGYLEGDLVVHFAGCWLDHSCASKFNEKWDIRHY